MYARNSTTNGNIGDNKRLWRQVNGSLQFDVDPNGQTTVVAFGVMGFSGSFATLNDFGAIWNAPGGGQNCEKITPTIASGGCAQTLHYPFLFGNPIQVAVTSIDKDGYESPIDPSKTLTMQDTFGPLVETSSQGMVARLTSDFRTSSNSSLKNNIVQRGQTFRKVMIVPWSEPLVTTTAPIFTSRGGQVTIVQQGTTVWDPFTALDQPINISDANGTPLTLSVPGACTEVMVARTGVPVGVNPLRGDTIIPVRNAGLFSVSASARVVFINPGYGSAAGSGAWIDEITGISAVDAANNRITLALGLQNSVPADALVCLVDAPATAAQNVISVGGTGGADVAVNNASMFMYGQTVALYRPQTGGNPDQIFEFFTVSGMDTVASPNFITLSGVPNAGQNTTSVIFPLPVGMTRYGSFAGVLYSGSCCFRGEYQLRTQNDLSSLLMTDVIGGNNTVVTLTFLSVGDTVLFDMDGDLLRTFNGSNAAFADQFFTTVKAIQFDASATTPTWSFTVDLPAGAVYIHGQSRVIALGDAFSVTGVQDTSATATSPHTVNTHQDTFTADTCPDCENGSVY